MPARFTRPHCPALLLPLAAALALFLAVFPAQVAAQHDMHSDLGFPVGFDDPMPLSTAALGPFSRPITTSAAEAQAYFDQGIQLLYSFTPPDAARSFREGQQDGGQFYHVLALLRFGRFDEILELHEAPEGTVYRGFWDFGRGYAHLRSGDVDRARIDLTRVQADRAADAEAVYRASLVDHPRNGRSLFGLEQALRAQGKDGEADLAHVDFEAAWARADHWIRASRYD